MKSENTPSTKYIRTGEQIKLSTKFGGLSRGRAWGKYFPGKTRPTGDFEWVEKTGGTLYLTGSGYYIVGSHDGFRRKARAEFVLLPAPEPAPAPEPDYVI